MKVSTKGRYGLRAMVDLAIHSTNGHVALYCIAERQNISVNYLEQVFSTLRKAGLVKSVKGAQGGYTLADIPSNITIGKILRSLEGNLSVVDENEIDASEDQSVRYCIKVNVWDKMTDSLNYLVDSITLEDLVNEYKKMSGTLATMYYI
ncbi:RrF2 family transcriptional regulator [Clostridium aminobutyricum]|uniref:Rrf2 family transcriptional regulator n=1 Tax=Clostridium aminobutyricum TaxID=33953 RepID=A0A939D7K9_CLOAM|nr:Rrf2 family transcriptional regulator [Clostridium aminobutyricum]MBN7772218.1 Rrf2 family transcriptional regulator [Clostridium aminobutyricum]